VDQSAGGGENATRQFRPVFRAKYQPGQKSDIIFHIPGCIWPGMARNEITIKGTGPYALIRAVIDPKRAFLTEL
jgi:hypothetical protein